MTAKQESVKKESTNLRYQRDRDRRPVKGIFRFHEVPNGVLEFVYKKYKEDPVETFKLHDGEVCTIPLGVAKHLNNNCFYRVHEHALDEQGKVSQKIGHKIQRCSFQSLEFMDEDISSNDSGIVTVENVR